ncbi:hypothetical protein SDA16_06945 [Legionella pneumophila serogroup 1]|uniref:Uncharacterized protein n=1 Tax=Legionella pneumophila TaxID=446 RepID=A0A140AYM3_LEGPN|nr:hypothetical protein [Legionella pneumophila]HCC3235841.1 hypothetical protein [Legionella pneumophila subsp. pneumophila]ALK43920.1 hypothetical protein [Legionella pneumophila]HAT2149823.1 hypothetical protein [Legionella pneumophila]HAT8621021.1 hypothetical protein [Legionella pneumophila]HAT8730851.1 hypothetical protein [Legionella pneumophila]
MIDYEKLKEAHELCYKLAKQEKSLLEINYNHRVDHTGKASDTYSLYGVLGGGHKFSLDELITKLKELTEPQPKYQLREIVWLFNHECNEIDCFKIDAISTKTLRYSGECCNSDFVYEEIPEKDLYPSREALIDAQIEYWRGLKQEQVVPVEEGSESKVCPKCGNKRVADGVCWQIGCNYVEPVKPEDMFPKFEGEIKGFRCFDDELEVRQCEHESESISSWGIIKSCEGDINKPFKCKKCGEFYR